MIGAAVKYSGVISYGQRPGDGRSWLMLATIGVLYSILWRDQYTVVNPQVDNPASFFKQKNSVSRCPPRISQPQHPQVISFPGVVMYHQMKKKKAWKLSMSSNTVFLTNFWKFFGDGKEFIGLGFFINEKNVMILLTCLTLSSCCISLKMCFKCKRKIESHLLLTSFAF